MKFDRSNLLREKVKKIIPGGSHTYSRGCDQFPQLSPGFLVRGKGVEVWDVDDNKFIDWGMGLRSVILGHAYPPILEAVRKQLEFGANFTCPTTLEIELAEKIIDLIPCAEMVKFAKNGSDVTTAAVKLARAYTGRDMIVRCLDQPFFSVHDWFIGDTPCNSGIPNAVKELTKHFRYNDIGGLEELLNQYDGKVACVILEPAATEAPNPGFLEKVRELTKKHGVILIFDEIITGFRFDPKGAQHYYGVTPDLATFAKGIANGFSFSALAGRRELLELGGLDHDKPRVFLLSTTYGAETHSLAAAYKAIDIMEDGGVSKHIWRLGEKLIKEFNVLVRNYGIEKFVHMKGIYCNPYNVFLDEDGNVDLSLRTLFLQETIQHGLLAPYIAISASHTDEHVAHFIEASEKAMPKLVQAIENNSTDGLLIGPAIKPVFRKYN